MSVLSVLVAQVAQWHKWHRELCARSSVKKCNRCVPRSNPCNLPFVATAEFSRRCWLWTFCRKWLCSRESGWVANGMPMVFHWRFTKGCFFIAFSLFFLLMWSLWWWCHGLPRRVRINPTPQLFLCKQWQAWDFPSFLTQNQALSFWEMQPGNEFSQGHHQFIVVFFSKKARYIDWSRRFGGVFNITCLVWREWQRCLLLL